jgi:hypothetical protein
MHLCKVSYQKKRKASPNAALLERYLNGNEADQ